MNEREEKKEFSEIITETLDLGRMMEDVETFSHLERYSGSPDGEQAAKIIAERMESLGIPVMRETYRIYRSLPGEASVAAEGPEGARIYPLTPYVYSGQADALEAALVYDRWEPELCTKQQLEERMRSFKGKLVLTHESSFEFACEAKAAGALGVLTIWHANLAHHGTLGGVWGSPEPEDLRYHYPGIPFAEICMDDGEELKKLCVEQGGEVKVCLNVKMDTGIRTSTMPVAKIQGKSDKFVLVSGHYDSWYEGVTDNGVANAAMMEMARVFKERQDQLNRIVVFAWWSGHSDGRYSGSTWYLDHHFRELSENCVAHINMDICGCKGSDLVGFNTSMLEGKRFAREFLLEFNDEEPIPPAPMARFADQTFWGAAVPFAIMPKFSRKMRGLTAFPWWHTREDTFDKVDPEIVLRDARVVAKLAAIFANTPRLPAELTEFAEVMEARLKDIEENLSREFDLTPVWPCLETLKSKLKQLEEELKIREDTDSVVKKIAGELVRITYTASSPYHQDPAIDPGLFPALSEAMGINGDNTGEDLLLAVETRFIRQRNRLTGQLQKVMEACDNQMLKWQAGGR